MAAPRSRHSNARKNSKHAHLAKKPKANTVCLNCRAAILPHHMCPSCGHYKGRSFTTEKDA
jgi:large subunit ribosomal protein L32